MLTALDDVDDKISGLDSGANDYLVKPFIFRESLARIQAQTRTYSRPTAAGTLTLVDLTLNRLTRRVERDGQEIALTSKEFALLEFFMLHPNQVLSRTQLGEHVWGQDYYKLQSMGVSPATPTAASEPDLRLFDFAQGRLFTSSGS